MKRGVILQPSFLPWRGFFELIHKSDVFVFLDDVQYDKHSWRNRNCIKTTQGKQWITVPILTKGKFGQKIIDTQICNKNAWAEKMLKTIAMSYSKAPYFDHYFPALQQDLTLKWDLLADLDIHLTTRIMHFLGLARELVRSSQLEICNQDRNGRLVEICQRMQISHYITGPSTRGYLDTDLLLKHGIQVEFMEYDYPPYPQLYGGFEPQISVVDLLFNAGPNASRYIWNFT